MAAITRRDLLSKGLAFGAGAAAIVPGKGLITGCKGREKPIAQQQIVTSEVGGDEEYWEGIREQFELSPDYIHMASMYFAANPRSVREAIERHRIGFERNPGLYVIQNNRQQLRAVHNSAADYLGVSWNDVALTGNTTHGLGLVYNGLEVREGQELLTTEDDYYSTVGSIRNKAQKSGASIRQFPLFGELDEITQDDIVERYTEQIDEDTRVLGLTWVHSSTGLKIPVADINRAVQGINQDRSPEDRIIVCVDGVHGFGIENVTMGDLDCDFFIAGTHKWLYGPRGTGIFWGNARARQFISPTIPTFTSWAGWGGQMSPGGFHAFEHRYALAQAFDWHMEIGKARIERRVHTLARRLKEGLNEIGHVRLITPMEQELSSGIVCFDVRGISSSAAARALRDRNIVATSSPYTPSHVRLTPGIINNFQDVDRSLEAVDDLR